MVLDLLKIDHDVALRLETRFVEIAAGDRRFIAAERLTWRWFDNLIAYDFAADQEEILDYVLRTMDAQGCDEGEALGLVVEYLVTATEMRAGDVTDDNLTLHVARRQQAKWSARRAPDDRSKG